MSVTIIATPGASNANSYLTLAEAQTYFDSRLPISAWDNADDQSMLLVMATRVLNALAQPYKTFFPGPTPYYRIRRQWTGAAATSTQRLAWPRIGMYDANGFAIADTVIPQDLKDATAEFAGQLAVADRTLDNDVIIQGLTSVRAGSVSLGFKNDFVTPVVPDAVFNLMPQSWLTDEGYELAGGGAEFEVL